MANFGVSRLFPAGTRLVRLFAAYDVVMGERALPLWDDAGMRVCKSRSRGRAVCGNGAFLKEYVYSSLWERFRRRFMPQRPFVSLEAARRLEELGVPTPRVLAASRGVAPDGTIRDLLVTEELPPGTVFGDKLAEELAEKRVSLASELVPAAFRLHENGFFHGDLSLRNWYRTPDGAWGLIDLDGASTSRRRVSKSRRTEELARLASSCFAAATRPGDRAADLAEFVRVFSDEYAKAGGTICPFCFARRSRRFVNRFRVKYLHMEALG